MAPRPTGCVWRGSSDIGNLDIGQSTSLQIVASPGAEISDGYYQYELRINAENDAGGKVPVTIAVAQSGEGGVRFKLVDIYTNLPWTRTAS